MEEREDLKSILPFLPVVLRSSTLFWPSPVVDALKALSRGPHHSRVDSGEVLFLAVSDIRNSLGLSSQRLASSASNGYSLFFDELLSPLEATKWFAEVLPSLANLLLRLPCLLETHYQNADGLLNGQPDAVKSGLRLLRAQEAGIVVLSQELIGALLACFFFCLFPVTNRGAEHLPPINFDNMFASLYDSYDQKLENKIYCIIHYFKRICSCMPVGFVSFERKVLMEHGPLHLSYPEVNLWSNSVIPLCHFEVHHSGLIEDQLNSALEVDFANKYIGGGALGRGCVQEEIRFMINPELIAGMLFLPSMADNESVEIVGAERFSNYRGYGSSFRFSGDYVDKKDSDFIGRRKTRIIAIDALFSPRNTQYKLECLLREVNKAFCGFFDHSKDQKYERLFQDYRLFGDQLDHGLKDSSEMSTTDLMLYDTSSGSVTPYKKYEEQVERISETSSQYLNTEDNVGIATGNWGCGAFGGDPELKTIIQWLAASQALRPFILYYTFGMESLQKLNQRSSDIVLKYINGDCSSQKIAGTYLARTYGCIFFVTQWILLHEWTVGDLWNMLVDYSSQKLKGETKLGFFTWLLPSLSDCDTHMSESPNTP